MRTIFTAFLFVPLFLRTALAAEQIILRPGENLVTSALLDEEKGLAYFGVSEHAFPYTLEQSSGVVIRIRLSPFARTGTLSFQAGENPLTGGLLNAKSSSAYFGIYGDPNRGVSAKVVEVDLARFRRTRAVTFEKNVFGIHSAVMEPTGRSGYFGTLYGTVVAVSLKEMTVSGSLGLSQHDNAFRCGVIDSQGLYAYFGTGTGDILRTRLSDFSPVGSMTLFRDDGFGAAALEPGGQTALFVTRGTPARIVRLRLSDMKAEPAFSLEPDKGEIIAVFVDARRSTAFLVSGGEPAQVIAVDLQPLKQVKTYLLPRAVGKITAAVFDPRHRVFLLGGGASPARILRWSVPD